ncbi:MAG: phosphoribosylanthranilate isomerase [Euryarchaeota archaeon]|nr:phosphoribosylanthranilate isomerase [Euryarchaeota archaeon]
MTLVKICGIMYEDDLDIASNADYIGLVVTTGTRRSLEPSRARQLRELSSIPVVMVTAAATVEGVLRLAEIVRPDIVQSHRLGPVELEKIRQQGFKVWAAMPVGAPGDIEDIMMMSGSAHAIVLDTPSPHGGGSGTVHDWKRSAAIREMVSIPIVLAGGLNPDNVTRAIHTVRPDVVDVSTGVETNGRKDAFKIEGFIRETKRCRT